MHFYAIQQYMFDEFNHRSMKPRDKKWDFLIVHFFLLALYSAKNLFMLNGASQSFLINNQRWAEVSHRTDQWLLSLVSSALGRFTLLSLSGCWEKLLEMKTAPIISTPEAGPYEMYHFVLWTHIKLFNVCF